MPGRPATTLRAIDAAGGLLWSVRVANEQRRIELVARAGRSGGQVRWAVDLVSPMASLLLAVLLTSGEDVVYVPGRMVSGLAGALGGEGKTDAKDAGSSLTSPGWAGTWLLSPPRMSWWPSWPG